MKKWIAIVLALICVFVLVGCNNRSMNHIIANEPNITGIVKDNNDNSILIENENGEYWVSLNVENKDSVTHFSIGDEIVVYYDGDIAESYPMQINTVYAIILKTPADRAKSDIEEMEQPETEIPGDRIPMVMVDGVLYYDTGKESTIEARCGMMDGEISSTVDASQIPTEDNQSNFGTGFGYQYGINNSIEIQMEDGTWYVFQREGTEYVEPTENTESTEVVDETVREPIFIRMENPSWEYYTAENRVSGTKPFGIKLLEETTNDITDTDAWFERNDLQLNGNLNEEEYGCFVENDGITVSVTQGGQVIAELEFTEYMYAPDMVEEDRDYVDERVRDAKIRNGVLYVSTSHLTYAESAPSNAYIMAISLDDYSVIWKSEPLVCNAYNFEIVDDIIFTGYGFTAEPDYLFQLDRLTGCVLEQYKIKSRADYIIYKEDKLFVRTYNTDYVFEVKK